MLIWFMFAILTLTCRNSNGKAFEGKGKVLFTYTSPYGDSGIRFVYRPQKYQKYSALGEGWFAKLHYSGYLSEHYARSNYYETAISDKENWPRLFWDSKGKYYYHDNDNGQFYAGYWFGYAVSIYDDDGNEIYTDQDHFYKVPNSINYCELDEESSGSKTKCSAVISNTNQAGKIAAGVLVPLLLIGITIGVVLLGKKRGWISDMPPLPAFLQRLSNLRGQQSPSAPQEAEGHSTHNQSSQNVQPGQPYSGYPTSVNFQQPQQQIQYNLQPTNLPTSHVNAAHNPIQLSQQQLPGNTDHNHSQPHPQLNPGYVPPTQNLPGNLGVIQSTDKAKPKQN